MKKIVFAALAATVLTAAAPAMAQTTVMRISHQLPPNHYLSAVIENWGKEIKEQTKGSIDFQVFPSSQLMSPSGHHAAVAQGALECAINANFEWGRTIPAMSATMRPFSIADISQLRKWPWSSAAKLLEGLLEEKGVRNIAWFFLNNVSGITSAKVPLIQPEDYKGVKIRGLNKQADAAFAAIGASPVAISGSEVYSALQTGLIDATLGDATSVLSRRFYEVQKYVTLSHVNAVYFHAFCNPKWLDALSAPQRDAIAAASAKAEQVALTSALEHGKTIAQQLADKGMNVHVQTSAEEEVLRAAMQPAFDKAFKEAAGPRAEQILSAIDQLTAR